MTALIQTCQKIVVLEFENFSKKKNLKNGILKKITKKLEILNYFDM